MVTLSTSGSPVDAVQAFFLKWVWDIIGENVPRIDSDTYVPNHFRPSSKVDSFYFQMQSFLNEYDILDVLSF